MATSLRLDELDRKLLALLQQQGRRSFADLGRDVGLSTPAVKRRVDRLEAAGVIRGYAAVVDVTQLGGGLRGHRRGLLRRQDRAPRRARAVTSIPEVVSAVTVSGEPDAVLRVQVEDIAHLERVIEALRRHPTIVRTRTMLVLSVLVDRPTVVPR